MTPEEFDDALRPYWWSEPFRPFIVEMNDGRIIEVEHNWFVFCHGGATYIKPGWEGIEEFTHDTVRSIRPAPREVSA